MNKSILTFYLFSVFLLACSGRKAQTKNEISYSQRMEQEKSADPVIEKRIDSILRLMTLKEKAGQMLHINLIDVVPADTTSFPAIFPVFDTARFIATIKEYGIGFMISDMALTPQKWAAFMNGIQNEYLLNSRLKIPFVFAACHQHGATYLDDATIFPHNINLAATFDTANAFNSGYVTSLETGDLGHNFIYVPVLDLGRNPRWSRFYETFGESYFLCSKMGASIVRGIQENPEILPFKNAACAKHFIGYSDPKSGWDRTPAHIPDQELYEFFTPSFQAAIDAGVKIIEANSGEVNGVPVHASHELLTTLLRDKMGFKGVLNSDWEDVKRLVTSHKIAENEKEATYLALNAGLDCILTPSDSLFAVYACELVQEGRIPEERIDLSVKRILRLKYELGLFDTNSFTRNARPDRINRPDSKQKALEAAESSLVLIKNENNILPLSNKKYKKILVTGPNANSKNNLAGGWTWRWQKAGDQHIPNRVKTVFRALVDEMPDTEVLLAKTAEETKSLGKHADLIIYVAGEEPYAESRGSIDDLTLPELQIREIETALAAKKPVVLMMVAGRPRIISKIYDQCNAFIWAGLPGYEGGTAIAEMLTGKINPSGKLPFAYPNTISHLINYNHKNSEVEMVKKLKSRWTIADFGSGLSYTTFSYENLKLTDSIISPSNNNVTAEIQVTNTGNRDGSETVLWFITDEAGSITRPVKELKHFEKQFLRKGETKKFIFKINIEKDLSYPDAGGNKLIESGYFTLQVGDRHIRFKLK